MPSDKWKSFERSSLFNRMVHQNVNFLILQFFICIRRVLFQRLNDSGLEFLCNLSERVLKLNLNSIEFSSKIKKIGEWKIKKLRIEDGNNNDSLFSGILQPRVELCRSIIRALFDISSASPFYRVCPEKFHEIGLILLRLVFYFFRHGFQYMSNVVLQ